jgi:2-amino-4-hydroxy-6-hydroxymethyldihydropteridine diphosphokinase
MNLVISTGSNLGNRQEHLNLAKEELQKFLNLVDESRIYESPAVDYLQQPDFLNQILVFEIPELAPEGLLQKILILEKKLGRERLIDKGPRTVDIDILFWGIHKIDLPQLTIPHPRLFQRSFIVLPLKELKIFEFLSREFLFPEEFENRAWPLTLLD